MPWAGLFVTSSMGSPLLKSIKNRCGNSYWETFCRHRERSFWLEMDSPIQVRDVQLLLQGLDPAEHLCLVSEFSGSGFQTLHTWSRTASCTTVKPQLYLNIFRWCSASPCVGPDWLTELCMCIVTVTLGIIPHFVLYMELKYLKKWEFTNVC